MKLWMKKSLRIPWLKPQGLFAKSLMALKNLWFLMRRGLFWTFGCRKNAEVFLN